MTGTRPNIYLLICIKYICPVIVLAMLVSTTVDLSLPGTTGFQYAPWNANTSTETESVPLPHHAIGIGFLIIVISVIWIPVFAFFKWVHFAMSNEEHTLESVLKLK